MRRKAGSTIGTLMGLDEKQVDDFKHLTAGEVSDIDDTPETDGNQVPEPLERLYEAAKSCCEVS